MRIYSFLTRTIMPVLLFSAVYASISSVYAAADDTGKPDVISPEKIDLRVCPDDIIVKHFYGFGAHGDYFLTRDFNVSKGVSDSDRKLIADRVRAMHPAIIRTFFDYKWWEPKEGVQTPDSIEMVDFIKWVRFLKSIGCKLMLNPWGDSFAYSDWMKPTPESKLPSPEKRDAMVRSLVDLVKYLRSDLGLTNVYYIVLMNEPDNDSKRPVDSSEYVRLNRLLDEKLKEKGIRKDVFLVTGDGANYLDCKPGEWFYETVSRGVEYADACSAHTYWHYDVSKLIPWIDSRTAYLKKQSEIPFMITEFNTVGEIKNNVTLCRENYNYEHGLFLADFAVTALNHRASSALMWCLFDTYYNETLKQEYGLWEYKDHNWKPRPGFYSWSLLTRYTRPGSRVVAVNTEPVTSDISSTALISPDGELTIMAVNRNKKPVTVNINTGLPWKSDFQVYLYTRQSIHASGDEMIEPSDTITIGSGDKTQVELPGESFVLLTDMRR